MVGDPWRLLGLIVQNRFVVMICPYYRMYSDNDLRSFAPLADVNGALHPEMNERLGFMIYPGTESGPRPFLPGVESGDVRRHYGKLSELPQVSSDFHNACPKGNRNTGAGLSEGQSVISPCSGRGDTFTCFGEKLG